MQRTIITSEIRPKHMRESNCKLPTATITVYSGQLAQRTEYSYNELETLYTQIGIALQEYDQRPR